MCRGAFTPSTRVVSGRVGRGRSFFGFRETAMLRAGTPSGRRSSRSKLFAERIFRGMSLIEGNYSKDVGKELPLSRAFRRCASRSRNELSLLVPLKNESVRLNSYKGYCGAWCSGDGLEEKGTLSGSIMQDMSSGKTCSARRSTRCSIRGGRRGGSYERGRS